MVDSVYASVTMNSPVEYAKEVLEPGPAVKNDHIVVRRA
jgi:hypothetical protein